MKNGLMKAQKLRNKGKFFEAKQEYASLYEAEPENVSLAKEYIQLLWETNQVDRAS